LLDIPSKPLHTNEYAKYDFELEIASRDSSARFRASQKQ